ncbi:STN1 [Acanthosepion pharaonis]|uniref:CST complex subunit STN1 n=1 Tax=Acanthosepion pharaonis TaxID=158019 RepID=A0A812BW90_ACAPH|nr:STN1 [Sepia pharaonis]
MPEYPTLPGAFAYKNHPIFKVDILGVVVKVDKKEKLDQYGVDDGTGVILCCIWKESKYFRPATEISKPNNYLPDLISYLPSSLVCKVQQIKEAMQMDFMLGDLIHIRGKITTFRQIRQITANFAGMFFVLFFKLWNFKLTAFFLLVIGIYTSSFIVYESISIVTEICFLFLLSFLLFSFLFSFFFSFFFFSFSFLFSFLFLFFFFFFFLFLFFLFSSFFFFFFLFLFFFLFFFFFLSFFFFLFFFFFFFFSFFSFLFFLFFLFLFFFSFSFFSFFFFFSFFLFLRFLFSFFLLVFFFLSFFFSFFSSFFFLFFLFSFFSSCFLSFFLLVFFLSFFSSSSSFFFQLP